jgi:uncharacterized protein YbcI
MGAPDETTTRGSRAAEISNRAVQLLHDYTGRGPTRAHTVINRDSVLILVGDTLTKGERTLAADGQAQFVLDMRHRFQMAMREDLIATVEQIMGRKVLAFMSDNHVDPDMAAEVFVLEPVSDDGAAAQ